MGEEWRGLESGREEEDGTVVRRREKREKGKEEEGTYMKSGQSYVSTNAQRAVQRRTTQYDMIYESIVDRESVLWPRRYSGGHAKATKTGFVFGSD